jgi:hypothetical protein
MEMKGCYRPYLPAHRIDHGRQGEPAYPQTILKIITSLVTDIAQLEIANSVGRNFVTQSAVPANARFVVTASKFISFGIEQSKHRVEGKT